MPTTTPTPPSYTLTPFYGGALTCLLPSTFTDASELRQVPDNQEVYLDSNGYTSLVVEILESVEKGSDREALEWHLKDITDGEDDGDGAVKVWAVGEGRVGGMGNTASAYTLLATTPPGAKQRGRAHEPDFVGIVLLLVRLVEQKTDILVSVNVPHVAGEYEAGEVDLEKGRLGRLLEKGVQIREKVMESLEVRDWGMFVQE
ncbi:hypothetical protein LTR91_026639 [Friedmanniomyces endolithicus]|uniref:Ran-interacting Mog1 protein n=1 Tax=Friedmanniomyces endolithicus TaxID=329885 RepID=A0AAN6GXT3_9PEZI|nr:hypothetical protein LTR94_017618 [Friedmanniomyces endolithicus]KAK0794257.1 hypothetical protein LTR59_007902 [Friedmanniomyces endolithicus]KAK0795651.1 hypothetical protein LTR75_010477 [Friedmanniomyces endolithicus]KAK0811168.1 hypothetical protein LTR38_003773 [Friedmanniomyces endolithicus]KAK0839869.1 hypothetical protein LTR03_010956 [Friedmanniomyces endolithicus]